jgi:hypothetical protein
MSAILNAINGKKTYIVAVLTGAAAAADTLGYHVPEGVYAFLAAAFGISIRHAVGKTA